MKKTVVTQQSLAAGKHHPEVVEAMRVLSMAPRPSLATTEGLMELARREGTEVAPGLTVASVLFKHNVVDCTGCGVDDDDEDTKQVVKTAVRDVAAVLAAAPGQYRVTLMPDGEYGDKPALRVRVSVDALRQCSKAADHAARLTRHLLDYAFDEFEDTAPVLAVFRSEASGDRTRSRCFEMRAYDMHLDSAFYDGNEDATGTCLTRIRDRARLHEILHRAAPMDVVCRVASV